MKKIIIQAGDLNGAMGKLGLAISGRSAMPAVEYLKIKASKNEMILIATDTELTIIVKIPCQAEEDFETLILYSDLKKIISLEKGSLEISIQEDGSIKVECGEDLFNLGIPLPVKDFPSIEKKPKGPGLILDESISHWINVALLTVDKDTKLNTLRPSLRNVLLHLNKDVANIVSTDTSCLFKKEIRVGSEETQEAHLQITPKMAMALKGMKSMALYYDKNKIAFDAGSIIIMGTMPEDKYPLYQRIIPEAGHNGSAFRYDLQNAILKSGIASPAFYKILIALGEKNLVLETNEVETGKSSRIIIDAKYSGECEKIAMSGEILLILLKQIPEEVQEILFSIVGPSRMATFQPKDDPSIFLLQAPMQLD